VSTSNSALRALGLPLLVPKIHEYIGHATPKNILAQIQAADADSNVAINEFKHALNL
jgi:hypothetical protein